MIIAERDRSVDLQDPQVQPGLRVIGRLVTGLPPDHEAIAGLGEPWGGIAADIVARNGSTAREALTKALASRFDAGQAAEIQRAILKVGLREGAPTSERRSQTISAAALLAKTFTPPREIVPHVVPEGTLILAGRPKVGKGRMALGLAVSVAFGGRALGRIPVEKGSVLYLGLEDGERRLQERLRDLLQGDPAPEGLDIATEWPRLNEGGLDELEMWLEEHPDARLIVIDTLKRVRPTEQRGASLYNQDYDAVAGITDLSHRYRVGVLIIHHTRKGDSDDPIELVSGSLGLSGAVDGALVLKCGQGQEQGTVRGRHREGEVEIAVQRDFDFGSWLLVGEPGQRPLTPDRAQVIQVIREAGRPLTPTEAASLLGKKPNAAKYLLWKMAQVGQLSALGDGRYDLPKPPNPTNPPNPTKLANPPNHEGNGGLAVTQVSAVSGLFPDTVGHSGQSVSSAHSEGERRDRLLQAGQQRNWRRLPLGQGRAIGEGEDCWVRFAESAAGQALRDAVTVAEEIDIERGIAEQEGGHD